MSNNWAMITPVEQKEIEEQGFSLLGSTEIFCEDCDVALVDVIKVKETDLITAVRVVCPHCDETSFWFKLEGKIYIQPKEDMYIDNVPTEIKNDIIYSTFVVKRLTNE